MLEGASLLAFYTAFALLHAASPRRFPFVRWQPGPSLFPTLKVTALLLTAFGIALWTKVETLGAALLVALAALFVSATLVVLGTALWPRAAWGFAVLCPLLAVALAIGGGAFG